ncbi:MAG: BlaI/MecI/CopY family transcriptional regulator [Dehalococcoidia bacterium]|nr:BlaI/MecI/CopY family transcriptional regulator [Dehalococcoidia bacterium]
MPKKAAGAQRDDAIAGLGSLESRIMEAMWRLGEASVREITDEIAQAGSPAYTTVMTVMTRLTDKGLLSRALADRAYAYRPATSREEYARSVAVARVRSLIAEFGDLAVAQFADELQEVDPVRARRLGELLRRRR